MSRNKYQGSKGKNQYEQKGIIRFEMMYDSWCLGCNRAIGKGTRYNAKKKKKGKYFSTTIWEFHMKCASCPQKFIIRTDPENRDYTFVEGIRRMRKTFTRTSGSSRDASDAFSAVERREMAKDSEKRVKKLRSLRGRDDYGANRLLRNRLRKRKKSVEKAVEDGKRKNLNFPLLPLSREDAEAASKIVFRPKLVQRPRKRKKKVSAPNVLSSSKGVKTPRENAMSLPCEK